MKILVTGAHFTTALAVIEELQKSKAEVVYVGRKTTREGDKTPSAESTIIPEKGIKFLPIITGRLQKAFTIYTIPSLLKIPIGFIQAFYYLLKEKPNVVLSFGGYVAVPTVISAWLLNIPVIIHEQTLVTGLANKISSYFAKKICVSFEKEYSFPKDKIVLTGNPLRREILENSKNISKNKKPLVFITGGNQGSHIINQKVEEVLEKLLKIANVVHQTGDSKYQDYERLVEKQNENYRVEKFIYDKMPSLLKNADLVVSRAGINTLTELAYYGTPTLLIPVPYLYKDEQNQNAKFFEKLGLVKVLLQSKLSADSLLESIKQMLKDIDQYKKNAKAARGVIITDAAKKIATEALIIGSQS